MSGLARQSTWADLARLHNCLVDAKHAAVRCLDHGASDAETDAIVTTLQHLRDCTEVLQPCLDNHPATARREARERGLRDA